jgi:hypothetical protein
VEQKLNKDQRSILPTENQYRDQLTERNTLLLTIYQYMDKILAADKSPVSALPMYRDIFHCIADDRRKGVQRK